MTKRDAFIMGWIFGVLTFSEGHYYLGGDVVLAVRQPFRAQEKLLSNAEREGLLTGELGQKIRDAVSMIKSVPDIPESFPGMEQQGSWQTGYFQGAAEKPLAEALEAFERKSDR